MKELENKETTQKTIQDIRPILTEKKFIGSIKPHKGHKLYEINVTNQEIKEIKTTKTYDVSKGYSSSKVDIKENCYYVSALNLKNAIKKFKKLFSSNQ